MHARWGAPLSAFLCCASLRRASVLRMCALLDMRYTCLEGVCRAVRAPWRPDMCLSAHIPWSAFGICAFGRRTRPGDACAPRYGMCSFGRCALFSGCSTTSRCVLLGAHPLNGLLLSAHSWMQCKRLMLLFQLINFIFYF